jgi:hypothetical protein
MPFLNSYLQHSSRKNPVGKMNIEIVLFLFWIFMDDKNAFKEWTKKAT